MLTPSLAQASFLYSAGISAARCGRSRMWPTEASTTYSSPKYVDIFLAFAGDSTMTSFLPFAESTRGVLSAWAGFFFLGNSNRCPSAKSINKNCFHHVYVHSGFHLSNTNNIFQTNASPSSRTLKVQNIGSYVFNLELNFRITRDPKAS